jgi:diacylglycerol kinase (ATP)
MAREKEKFNGSGGGRLFRALRCSILGFKAAYRHEEAFREELLLSIVFIPLGLWLGNTGPERALLAGCMILLLIVELLNSAVEAVVDRIGIDYHELSGRAKDLGSAAVFLAIINAIIIWLLVLC